MISHLWIMDQHPEKTICLKKISSGKQRFWVFGMEPLKTGDWAVVSVGSTQILYPVLVDSETNNIFVIRDQTNNLGNILVFSQTNQSYQILGYDVPHTISFFSNKVYQQQIPEQQMGESHMSESYISNLPEEILMEIGLHLPYKDLKHYCLTSKAFLKICENERFWHLRVEKLLPGSGRFKDPKRTWKAFYKIMRMKKKTVVSANKSAAKGETDVLEWFASLDPPILPSSGGVSSAVKNGHLDTLLFLAKHHIKLDLHGIYLAAKYGHLNILKWIHGENADIIQTGHANGAADGGHIDILLWMIENDIFPDVGGANSAAASGHLEVLKLLAKYKIFPDVVGARWAAERHLDVLKWLSGYGILPDSEGFENAVYTGNIEIVKWLIDNNIFPDDEDADSAASRGYLDLLELFASLEPPVLPTIEGISDAVLDNQLDVLKWSKKHNIDPDSSVWIDIANEDSQVKPEIADWLLSIDTLPNNSDLMVFLENERIDMLDIIYSHGIIPLVMDIDIKDLIVDGKLDSLNWLLKNKLLKHTLNSYTIVLEIIENYVDETGIKILDWLSKLKPPIVPVKNHLDQAFKDKNLVLAKYMLDKGIRPFKYTVSNLKQDPDALSLLAQYGIYPTK